MARPSYLCALALISLLIAANSAFAQVRHRGTPVDPTLLSDHVLETVVMGKVDVAALLAEDAKAPKDEPLRFAHSFPVDLSLANSGSWSVLDDGRIIWRLRIDSPGALSLNFILSEFELTPGSALFVYNANRTQVLGAYTWENNKPNRRFAIQPIDSDNAIFELVTEIGMAQQYLTISVVNHGYRSIGLLGFGDSGICNVNTVCSEGDAWRDQIRSVAMILTRAGSRLCSGAMINNARQDGSQYFLTAYHCLSSSSPDWILMFNYASSVCPRSTQTNGPTQYTVQGTRTLSSGVANDYALLQVLEPIPSSYNIYYSGFSAEPVAATSVVGIHHPSGDVKKFCSSNRVVLSSDYYGRYPDSHWHVTQWDVATTEPGSSGSPLFDQNKRIVGQLHGGAATCSFQYDDYYGKFSQSWTAGLKAFLDPDNTGILTVDGRNA